MRKLPKFKEKEKFSRAPLLLSGLTRLLFAARILISHGFKRKGLSQKRGNQPWPLLLSCAMRQHQCQDCNNISLIQMDVWCVHLQLEDPPIERSNRLAMHDVLVVPGINVKREMHHRRWSAWLLRESHLASMAVVCLQASCRRS